VRIAQSRNRRGLAFFVLLLSGLSWVLFAIKHNGTLLFTAVLWMVVAGIALLAPEQPEPREEIDPDGRPDRV
jgi:hypothetical protein